MAKANVPAVKGGTAVAVSEADKAFEAFAGQGFENVTARDMLIPRLTILQALSLQVNKKKSEYIPGAEVGMIADVATGQLFPNGINFLPVHWRKDFLEWFPRSSNKGLAAVHRDPAILDKAQRNDKGQPVLPNGNYVAETAQWFGLNLSANRMKCFIPMASTQLKKSRRWVTLATGEKLQRPDGSEFTPPLFYRCYTLTTGEETNNEGTWYGWKIERGPALPEIDLGTPWKMVLEDCVRFREALIKGEADADVSGMTEGAEAAAEEAM